MRAKSKHAFAALMAILLAAAAGSAAAEDDLDMAPDFLIRQCVRVDSIMLSDYLDGPVLLVFYDGGFVTNITALRYAKEWDRRYGGDGLSTIAIHSPFLEPSRIPHNAIEVVGITGAMIPVGLDMEREVYDLYGISALPAFVLIRPGGAIAANISGEKVYADVERAVQEELKRLKPDIILPLIARPIKPWDDPEVRVFPATPLTQLGYVPGNIANADSSLRNEYGNYEDPWDRTREVVFLNGDWNVSDYAVTYSDSVGGVNNHIRIIYKAKSVWILPAFEIGHKPKLYIKQDRSYLDNAVWGKDVTGDQLGKPQVAMTYSIPYQIVNNAEFGAHQLELIPGEGDVSVYYLYFEPDVQK